MKIFRALALAAVVVSSFGVADAAPRPVAVKGGYINDGGCLPVTAPKLGAGTVTFTCTGSSSWTGGWTGQTVISFAVTVDTAGNFWGTADEWLYGAYRGDNSTGGIRFIHSVRYVSKTDEFTTVGRIVGGTCAFAGSTGSAVFTGTLSYGGYTASWARAGNTAPAGCNPVVVPPAPSMQTINGPACVVAPAQRTCTAVALTNAPITYVISGSARVTVIHAGRVIERRCLYRSTEAGSVVLRPVSASDVVRLEALDGQTYASLTAGVPSYSFGVGGSGGFRAC